MKNKDGFTLTELLITIAVIGILAAIALPRYLNQEVARISEATTQLSAISLSEKNYRINTGTYVLITPTAPGAATCSSAQCWADIGMDNPHASAAHFFDYDVQGAVLTQFCAIATRNSFPTADNQGQRVCLDELGQYSGNHPNGPNPGGTGNNLPNTCSAFC